MGRHKKRTAPQLELWNIVNPVKLELSQIRRRVFELDLKVDKLEARERQVIVLFKSLLEIKYRKYEKTQPITIDEILKFMDKYVREGTPETQLDTPLDLMKELESKDVQNTNNT